jgi:hypothetical protein
MYVYTPLKEGGKYYVLARHCKLCKLANWSRPSNIITNCSRAPGCATKEQAKQLNIHMWGELST